MPSPPVQTQSSPAELQSPLLKTFWPVPFSQVAESYMRSTPLIWKSCENKKSIDALKQLCIAASRDVIPINNFNPSLLSATKAEITQARQDMAAVHGNAVKQRVFAAIAACRFLRSSAFSPMTTKWQWRFCCLAKVSVVIILFTEIYYFTWLLPNAVWSMVCRQLSHFL